jgi:hypothetical protein
VQRRLGRVPKPIIGLTHGHQRPRSRRRRSQRGPAVRRRRAPQWAALVRPTKGTHVKPSAPWPCHPSGGRHGIGPVVPPAHPRAGPAVVRRGAVPDPKLLTLVRQQRDASSLSGAGVELVDDQPRDPTDITSKVDDATRSAALRSATTRLRPRSAGWRKWTASPLVSRTPGRRATSRRVGPGILRCGRRD